MSATAATSIVVTEVSSPKRAIRVDDAVFTPADGYRQQDTAGLYTEVGKGEKAMTVFSFPDAKIGGKLRLEAWTHRHQRPELLLRTRNRDPQYQVRRLMIEPGLRPSTASTG